MEYSNYINGAYTAPAEEKITVLNPSNEKVVGFVPKSSREEAKLALEAAKNAYKGWSQLTAVERAAYIYKLADALDNKAEDFAILLTEEQGKPITQARGEVKSSSAFLRYAAEYARRIEGDIITSENKNEQIWIQRVPYGVVVGICAWNFPLALACRKIGGGLVCGNTMVIKPPSETPLAVMKMGELCDEIGMPKGVLNFISGGGSTVGDELVRNPITAMVTLTGSTGAGRQLYHGAADNITDLRLELGGKAPFVVMEDADIDSAVQAAVDSRFGNCGQVCTCNERMYIHESVYDEFKDKFVEKVKKLKVGNPMNEDTDIGPKVNLAETEKLCEMIEEAKTEGAKIILGGNRLTEGEFAKGYWLEPTVVEVNDNKNILMQEETFGPIAPMMKISSFEEAMEYSNDCCYGLSAYLFTKNVKYIMRMVKELEFGEVYVNRCNGELLNGYHSGYKQSGVGGEDGKYGLEGYLQKKTVYMNYNNI